MCLPISSLKRGRDGSITQDCVDGKKAVPKAVVTHKSWRVARFLGTPGCKLCWV